jgi:hypothetical protein
MCKTKGLSILKNPFIILWTGFAVFGIGMLLGSSVVEIVGGILMAIDLLPELM